jgi:hypothetical protein
MRTRQCVTTALAALTILLLAGSPDALAQDGSRDSVVPATQRFDCIATPAAGAPFSAEAVTTWHPPANSGRPGLSMTARYYRDSAGRVRVDFVEGNGQEKVILTDAAERRAGYELDTAERVAFYASREHLASLVGGGCGDRFLVPVSMNHFVSFRGMPLDEESLGTRSLEGVEVLGTRYNTRRPLTTSGVVSVPGERWISPELKLVVSSRMEDSVVGVVGYQLRNIIRSEPPAELFQLPTEYTVTFGPYGCWTWDNPYAPAFGHSHRHGFCDDNDRPRPR